MRVSLRWNWSWGFGLFIALPAFALALLGLRAVRAERIERQEQLREQQVQVARLIDAAISNRMAALEVDVRQHESQSSDASKETLNGFYVFSLDQNNILKFPSQRVYFGEQSPPAWSETTENLIDQAQAAKAQGRNLEAVSLYRRIIEVESKLSAWAQLSIASLKRDAGDTGAMNNELANAELADSDATTPTGLPLALIACAYVEQLPTQEQTKYALFVQRTIESLRHGRWWLSYDERSFYDGQLRQMLGRVGAKQPSEDHELKQLAAIAQIVHRSLPPAGNEISRSFDRAEGEGFLISWSRAENGSTSHDGFAFSQDGLVGLFDSILSPLLSGQSFSVEVRDAEAHSVWAKLQGRAINTQPLRGVRGLELTFSGLSGSRWLDQKQLLWFGFILLLVVMMIAGLAMTARVVRREMELGRIQNDFIAAVSHEFKSPIASIRLLMERITNGRLRNSETTAEYYAAISREAERLERLVNRLLEWQQIQAGRKRYNFSPASLTGIATTAIEEMRPQAEAKGIILETAFEKPLPQVNTDEAALTDAIENLIDNAIKYSPSDTRITVSCSSTDHQACVEVHDQGVGIANDELPHIFDRFYRGRRGDMSNVHGTGLGLALVKATVEAHGGEVEVTSEPGVGSCFRLRLPINNGV
ncbi:MAG: sensor histidine kinase [Pyrinomonadaceae bacterium]